MFLTLDSESRPVLAAPRLRPTAVLMGTLLASAAACGVAQADAVHSDIEFEFVYEPNGVDGVIEVEFSEPGLIVFEADFADEPPFDETEDPGFDNEEKDSSVKPVPGSLLSVYAVEALTFWDGSAFVDAGSATITMVGALSEFVVDATSGVGGVGIALADALGDIHTHVDFELADGAAGAYGLTLALTTDQFGIDDSAPFGLFINNGLGEVAFEAGVDAFNAQVVPVPAAVWMFGGALGLLATRTRRN